MLLSRISLITALVTVSLTHPLINGDSLAQIAIPLQGPPPGGFERRGDSIPGERFLEQLDLSEGQKQQISEIRAKYEDEIAQNQDDLRSAAEELRGMMVGTESEAEIRNKYKEVSSLRDSLVNLHFESLLEIREVLTPEQRQELADLMEQRTSSGRGGRGRGFR